MPEPEAYLGGRFIPQSQASVPVYDAGFMLGATVSEQLRTFRGKLFRLDDHLARLRRSLEIVGVELPMPFAELAGIAADLAARNRRLLAEGDDLGLSMFVTPGPYATLAGAAPLGPTVGLHTYPLPFKLWASKYEQGESLAITDVEQVSPRCWPAELKCRSRMHYYLADLHARRTHPGARALMTDGRGHVLETSTSNLLIVARGELIGPPRDTILPGISLTAVVELAEAEGIAYHERELSIDDVKSAEEVLLTSTPSCLLAATRIGDARIGGGAPREVFRRLLAAWTRSVGIDIAEQALAFAGRN